MAPAESRFDAGVSLRRSPRVATWIRAAGLAVAASGFVLSSCQSTWRPSSLSREECVADPPRATDGRTSGIARASTPADVIAPLLDAIDAALCAGDANRAALTETAAALRETLTVERDVMPLGRVRLLLEEAEEPDDLLLQEVLRALADTQRSYLYGEVVPGRPTLLLVHGSDRGPFDTFARYFEIFGDRSNVLFVVYDSFRPTAEKASWLTRQVRLWKEGRADDEPLHVIAWSDGTTILRKARLDDEQGLFRGARIVNLAPPLAGSHRARWVDEHGARPFFAFPALLYLESQPHLVEMAREYNPYGDLMLGMYDPSANRLLAERLGPGAELNVVVEGDAHAPEAPWFDFMEPEFETFALRYRESLGSNHVRLPARTENAHRDVTRDPDAIAAVLRHLDAGVSIFGSEAPDRTVVARRPMAH